MGGFRGRAARIRAFRRAYNQSIASRSHMLPSSEPVTAPQTEPAPRTGFDFRLLLGILLLAIAAVLTWRTIEELELRRNLRTQLAEISHVRYDLLNADRWVAQLVPILEARIDALDL